MPKTVRVPVLSATTMVEIHRKKRRREGRARGIGVGKILQATRGFSYFGYHGNAVASPS